MVPAIKEIDALRREEWRQEVRFAEVDRLVRALLPHYACDFVVGEIPDGHWLDPREGPVPMLREGLPPRGRKGPVVASLAMMRRLAEECDAL